MTKIYPVILAVPEEKQRLAGREKVAALSALARRALAVSAELSAVRLPDQLVKDGRGAPIPFDGTHWSLTHKPARVAAVLAPEPVGIDIETVRPFHPGLPDKIATKEEWCLSDQGRSHLFFRYWTAKEAVLKATGTGIANLSNCKIAAVPGKTRTMVRCQGRDWEIQHLFFDDHVAAVTAGRLRVQWTCPDLPGM